MESPPFPLHRDREKPTFPCDGASFYGELRQRWRVHAAWSAIPQECREHARQCFESARSAPTLTTMARFEGLAHSWLRLAEDLERAKDVAERLKAPER